MKKGFKNSINPEKRKIEFNRFLVMYLFFFLLITFLSLDTTESQNDVFFCSWE